MATISKENYLKAIYTFAASNNGTVSLSDLAKELSVSNAAVTEMANKLSKQGYITYEKYKGISIREKGKNLARNIIRKHRLWEIFLVETLGFGWGEVHYEAERLEHCTTSLLIDRIDSYLNYPKLDPHGEPVPNKDGNYRTTVDDIKMTECVKGQTYIVSRVKDRNPELISYLSKLNISLNKKIEIVDKLSFDGSIIISVDGINHSLSEKLINNIYLSEVERK